jgi:hypothetical protein
MLRNIWSLSPAPEPLKVFKGARKIFCPNVWSSILVPEDQESLRILEPRISQDIGTSFILTKRLMVGSWLVSGGDWLPEEPASVKGEETEC